VASLEILKNKIPRSEPILPAAHRVHTDMAMAIGVYSIMMEKSAQPGEGGGCTPNYFHYIYHYVQSYGVCSSWEDRYTPPISTLPLYVLCAAASIRLVGP
jgi:hypothetical protein